MPNFCPPRPAALEPFNFEGTTPVRVVLGEDGEPWFSAADVCAALSHSNPSQALAQHVDADDLTKREVIDALGRRQVANFINESGIYALVMGSTLPTAKKFKTWVTREVLPAIRKTGTYTGGTPKLPGDFIEALEALVASEKEKRRLAQENEAQRAQLVAQQPAVDLAEKYLSAKGDRCLRDAATALGMPPKQFNAYLMDKGLCYRRPQQPGQKRKNRLLPHAEFVTKGYLVNRARLVERQTPEGTVQDDRGQTMVTPQGMAWLHARLEREAAKKGGKAPLLNAGAWVGE